MVTAPHPSDLLAAWEEGEGRPPVERALTLLALDAPERREALAALTIAERDERLLALHARLWGDRLDAFSECPGCAERLELAIEVGALGRAPAQATWTVEVGGSALRFRLPDSADLAEAARCADAAEGRRVLAARCVEPATGDELPEAAVAAIAARMADVAGPADAMIAVTCPACGHAWEEGLDIAAFVWRELTACVSRLIAEVDALARAYGWSEAAVLALPPRRRHRYLEAAG